jgi:hypothetical protein
MTASNRASSRKKPEYFSAVVAGVLTAADTALFVLLALIRGLMGAKLEQPLPQRSDWIAALFLTSIDKPGR